MSWETKKLCDLCLVITKGTTPSNIGEGFTEYGVKYIRSEMITSARNISGEFLFISPETHEKLKRSQLQAGDILFSMAGVYLGKTALLREEDVPANTNQAVALIRVDRSKYNHQFIYYCLNLPQIVSVVNTIQSQSAQPNINLKQIGNLEIKLPNPLIQKKIADILSAYDDLIENNRKQIKLLEEAAQRLYKEWFVDLRFPGHEHSKIVDGVPEGWEVDVLSNVVKTTSGGTPARSHSEYYVNGSNLWVKTQELTDGFILDTEEKITDDAIKNSSAKLVSKGSILMAMYGATIGRLGIATQDLTCNQACCVFDVSDFKYGAMYLFCWLLENRSFLIKLGKGAAQSNLSQTMIKNLNIVIPSPNILHEFSCIVDSLYSMILANQKRITKLSEARDRLLPKLMSGEVEV